MILNTQPRYEILSEDALETLDRGWRRIVSEIGIEFQHPEAIAHFRTAGQQVEEQVVAVPGPDAWSEALFQLDSIARIARDIGDWDLAEYTAQKMIRHDPSYAGGHFARALVAEHGGDALIAQKEFAMGEKLWSKADPGLQKPRAQKQ